MHFGVVTYFAVKLLSWNHNSNISIIFGYWVECPVKWLGYRERGKDCWKMWSRYRSKFSSQVCSAIASLELLGMWEFVEGCQSGVQGSTICSDGSSLVQIIAYWSGGKNSVTTIFFVCVFSHQFIKAQHCLRMICHPGWKLAVRVPCYQTEFYVLLLLDY